MPFPSNYSGSIKVKGGKPMPTTRAAWYIRLWARCIPIPQDVWMNGRRWIFSIVQFWIPQFEGILDQLDPLIPWGKGDGNDVETGLYIIQMLLVEVCQRNLG